MPSHQESRWHRFKIRDPRLATLAMVTYAFASGCLNTYFPAMITTLEKRFELQTSHLGWLMSGNDIGFLCSVIFVAYYGGQGNHARVLSVSGIGLFLSAAIYSSPFFIFGPKFDQNEVMERGIMSSTKDYNVLCVDNFTRINSTARLGANAQGAVSDVQKLVSFSIMMFGMILNGVAASAFWNVGLAFLDDIAGANSGPYMAFLFAIRAISPIIGYSFGALLVATHETLQLSVKEFPSGEKDPSWVGAWWLGTLILGGCVLLVVPTLALLDDKLNADGEGESTKKTFSMRELFDVLLYVFRNRVLCFLLFAWLMEMCGVMILANYLPKYLEQYFRLDASTANVMTAISLSGPQIICNIISGYISKRWPMSMPKMTRFNLVVKIISYIIAPTLLLFSCSTVQVLGANTPAAPVCASDCTCPVSYKPVCLNSVNYMTACFAGCSDSFMNGSTPVYTDCDCAVAANSSYASTFNPGNFTAAAGLCESSCAGAAYGFVSVVFIIYVVSNLSQIQMLLIYLRVSGEKGKESKPVAMAVSSIVFNIVGIVIPPLSGRLIDSLCTVNQSFSGRSFCLLYNTADLKTVLIGVVLGFLVPQFIFFLLAHVACSRLYPSEDPEADNNGNGTVPVEMEPLADNNYSQNTPQRA